MNIPSAVKLNVVPAGVTAVQLSTTNGSSSSIGPVVDPVVFVFVVDPVVFVVDPVVFVVDPVVFDPVVFDPVVFDPVVFVVDPVVFVVDPVVFVVDPVVFVVVDPEVFVFVVDEAIRLPVRLKAIASKPMGLIAVPDKMSD